MKPKIIIGVVIIIVAIVFLIFSGLKETAVYYLTISEIKMKKDLPPGRALRVSGEVLPETVEWNAEKIQLRFTLVEGNDSLHVEYHGTLPDQIGDAQQVVAEGALNDGGVFVAKKILLKCPSKYEAGEE